MKKSEWQSLVQHICDRSIRPHIEQILHRMHPLDHNYKYKVLIDRLVRAMQTIRYIETNIGDDEDLNNIFTHQHLTQLLLDLLEGLRTVKRLMLDTGIADEIYELHADIVERMDVDDFPDEDLNLMRRLGYNSPEDELLLIVRHSKRVDERMRVRNSNDRYHLDYSQSVTTAIEILECRQKNLKPKDEEPPEKKPNRKWLKGLGAICSGSALTIVDATLLGGLWTVPAHMASVGAVVSITAGLDKIASGAGDLRGE
jgi:hypothetical protein